MKRTVKDQLIAAALAFVAVGCLILNHPQFYPTLNRWIAELKHSR